MSKNKTKHYDVYELIAKNIKYYRKERKMTQAKLAEITEYSHEFIRRIEAPNSKKNFSLETVSNIAAALDIDLELLFSKKLIEKEEEENNQK